ncbi:MAG: fimbria major subunit [Bacteroides sp.]|nr:fimbria major subunit [Bacteroides sp.]
MKKFLTLSVYVLMACAIVTSCNDDKTDAPIPPQGEGNVQIKVSDANARTRAYDGFEQAEAGEVELADHLAVFVYDQNGSLDYQNLNLPVNAQGVTDLFKVSEGMKYFYVFSNGDVSTLPSAAGFADLESEVLRVTFQDNRPKEITTHGAMTIGTLWRIGDVNHPHRNLFDVQPNKYGGDPNKVALRIGRTAAKIRLIEINKEQVANASPLKGIFDNVNAIYRLRSVPDKYFRVGKLDSSGDYPPTTGLRYLSAVHDIGPGSLAFPSDTYIDYFWDETKKPSATDHYYAVENTTKSMEIEDPLEPGEHLYYGNTTYVQFRIAYTPDASEIYSPTVPPVLSTTGIPADGTFYTARYNGQVMIFDSEPPTTGNDFVDPKVYTEGIMYYKFPVRDPKEIGTERQCAVIRNHYYGIKVNNIFNLGEPTDEVDPKIPINDTDPDVEITVEVLDWFKVEQGVDL